MKRKNVVIIAVLLLMLAGCNNIKKETVNTPNTTPTSDISANIGTFYIGEYLDD